jgi:FkbM family methyltransferase
MNIVEHNNFYYNKVSYPQVNNSAVVKALLKNKIWEKKITNIFQAYIKKDWIVVDVGAYIGLHTLTMSKLANTVYSFEPQPLIYQCVKNTLTTQKIENVILHHVALSNNLGMTNIHTNNNGDASLEGIRDTKFSMSFPVNTKTLDSYNIDKINLIKIDVEGHEWEMIEGASNSIIKNKPIIILETFKTKKNIKKIEEFILQYNYTYTYISADNYLLLPN